MEPAACQSPAIAYTAKLTRMFMEILPGKWETRTQFATPTPQ
jgi:hypothetical protein